MRIVTTVFYLLLILIGISFAALNASAVHINFYFKTFGLVIPLGTHKNSCLTWHIEKQKKLKKFFA